MLICRKITVSPYSVMKGSFPADSVSSPIKAAPATLQRPGAWPTEVLAP
jgi:hypothetical protein